MLNSLIDGLLAVCFPEVCPCCGRVMVRGERVMCLSCRLSLPLTNFHLSATDNEMRSKLNGLVAINKAVAYFHYSRLSPHAALIHDAKYRGRPRVARLLAQEYARILQPAGFFDDIDALVPVPLNFWKECRRGYNQSAHICSGLAEVSGLPVLSALKARRHKSQTRKSGAGRREDISGVFRPIAGATSSAGHVLLVDDICTTGSTLYACAKALRADNPSLTISVLSLASTRLL